MIRLPRLPLTRRLSGGAPAPTAGAPDWAVPLSDSQQLVDGEANVSCDLAQQCRRDIASGVKRNRGAPSVGMAKLFVRATLPHLGETVSLQKADDLARLQNWDVAHSQAT